MNTPVLQATEIEKYFYSPQPFHALKKVSINILRGEFVALVGKSGCGKSTLLYILSTMDTSYEGKLYLDGELLTGKSGADLATVRNAHIGFVFQFHYLLPEFTVLQNVMLPALKLAKYTKREIEQKAIEKLTLLGLEAQLHKPANKLSGGQQQRVAIARSQINDPDILICDEPTGNLDSENSNLVFDIFKELTISRRQTIIVVTHDNEFAKKTDRIIEMKDGYILN